MKNKIIQNQLKFDCVSFDTLVVFLVSMVIALLLISLLTLQFVVATTPVWFASDYYATEITTAVIDGTTYALVVSSLNIQVIDMTDPIEPRRAGDVPVAQQSNSSSNSNHAPSSSSQLHNLLQISPLFLIIIILIAIIVIIMAVAINRKRSRHNTHDISRHNF